LATSPVREAWGTLTKDLRFHGRENRCLLLAVAESQPLNRKWGQHGGENLVQSALVAANYNR